MPPIPPIVRKLETILISMAVRLLPPKVAFPPVAFYIPFCEFPFRAVRPTGKNQYKCRSVVSSYLQLPSFTSSLPPTHAPLIFICFNIISMSVSILYQWRWKTGKVESNQLQPFEEKVMNITAANWSQVSTLVSKATEWNFENLQHLQDFSPTDHVSLVSLNL